MRRLAVCCAAWLAAAAYAQPAAQVIPPPQGVPPQQPVPPAQVVPPQQAVPPTPAISAVVPPRHVISNPVTPPAVARAPAPPAPPMPPVKGLPAGAPQIVINGGTYSPRADHRLAIVNGNVVREGADLGSGVVLESIEPEGVVLAFRGARYHVVY